MNPVIKAQVGDYAEINAVTDRDGSELFEIYSIYSILNGGLGESIDPLEAHLAGSEFGLDGVAILVQGRLVCNPDDAREAIEDVKNPTIDFYFFQSKTGTNFDYGNISKFFDAITEFFDGGMTG